MSEISGGCRDFYGWDDDDTKPYNPKWETVPKENYSDFADVETPWVYQSAYKLLNAPFMGTVNTYKGGGYVVNFERNMRRTHNLLKELQDQNWLDLRTRAVFVEFTVYNPNVNLFAAMTMLTEFVPTGSALSRVDLKVSFRFVLAAFFVLKYAWCARILLLFKHPYSGLS